MNRLSAVILTAAALTFAVGCGGGNGLGIKEGDKLVVTQTLDREPLGTAYGESVKKIDHTDGDLVQIPEGTVVEVFVTPKSDAKIIEVRPVKSKDDAGNDITDEEALKDKFVQERFRTPDFLYYTISLKAEYLGTKVKKIE
ncbi:hypothetical protein R80B4_01593 [Fibrobacteres bacterium R8-0-B4]